MEGNLRLPERLHILEVLPKPSLFLVTVVTLTVIGVYKIVAWYREYCVSIVDRIELEVTRADRASGGY
jgi:16S rRNA U1498 N3-methylase RsmE